MKQKLSDFMEAGRLRDDYYKSAPGDLHGIFIVRAPWGGKMAIMSAGVAGEEAWEHVSVSFENRAPSWREMCWVKDQFWNDDECVIQFHPPKTEYVNCHPHCLHLWRHNAGHQSPPPSLVGPRPSIVARAR